MYGGRRRQLPVEWDKGALRTRIENAYILPVLKPREQMSIEELCAGAVRIIEKYIPSNCPTCPRNHEAAVEFLLQQLEEPLRTYIPCKGQSLQEGIKSVQREIAEGYFLLARNLPQPDILTQYIREYSPVCKPRWDGQHPHCPGGVPPQLRTFQTQAIIRPALVQPTPSQAEIELIFPSMKLVM